MSRVGYDMYVGTKAIFRTRFTYLRALLRARTLCHPNLQTSFNAQQRICPIIKGFDAIYYCSQLPFEKACLLPKRPSLLAAAAKGRTFPRSFVKGGLGSVYIAGEIESVRQSDTGTQIA